MQGVPALRQPQLPTAPEGPEGYRHPFYDRKMRLDAKIYSIGAVMEISRQSYLANLIDRRAGLHMSMCR